MEKPRCAGENNVHLGTYMQELYRRESCGGVGDEIVFSWCSECGLASVDLAYDRMHKRSITGLRVPNLLTQLAEELNKRKPIPPTREEPKKE